MTRTARGLRPTAGARALCIVHYHFRPGGVRRVIELAAAPLAKALRADGIVLIAGEKPPVAWLRAFRANAGSLAVRVRVDPALGYAERRVSRSAVRAALEHAIQDSDVVWAHNLALGRNLALSTEVAAVCAGRNVPLLAHHHDWWCDRRWARWPVIRRCGFRTLNAVTAAIFPAIPRVSHIAINQADAAILRRHFPKRAHWLPNPIERPPRPIRPRASSRPLWFMPCRVLRRKNIAEALLLTRWLRPEATLVVSGTADEIDEMPYAAALGAAAREHGWPLQLGALAAGCASSVADLYAQAEAIVFTSIQEGFGLPQLEAAATGHPAIIRRVPLVAPDLGALGFRFPHLYDDVRIAPDLFDWSAEVRRQTRAFRAWLRHLPHALRPLAESPSLLAHRDRSCPVPFSRLTFTAQIEVLRAASEESWARCAPLNPWLRTWRRLAARAALTPTAWPSGADRKLAPIHFADRLAAIASSCTPRALGAASRGLAAQRDFIRARLRAEEMFPLLWSAR